MLIPIIILLTIPILLGIVYVSPFDQPEKIEPKVIQEEPDGNILYFILVGIWAMFLLKILHQLKKGTFKVTQRY